MSQLNDIFDSHENRKQTEEAHKEEARKRAVAVLRNIAWPVFGRGSRKSQ